MSRRQSAPARQTSSPPDPMRIWIFTLTALFAAVAAGLYWAFHDSPGSIGYVTAVGSARFALVLTALWIAWPTVRKPAMWLPPGIAAVAVVALGACVVQPRLAIAIIPLISALIAFAGFLRMFRGN